MNGYWAAILKNFRPKRCRNTEMTRNSKECLQVIARSFWSIGCRNNEEFPQCNRMKHQRSSAAQMGQSIQRTTWNSDVRNVQIRPAHWPRWQRQSAGISHCSLGSSGHWRPKWTFATVLYFQFGHSPGKWNSPVSGKWNSPVSGKWPFCWSTAGAVFPRTERRCQKNDSGPSRRCSIRQFGLKPAVRYLTYEGLLWSASSPYELALNSSFYGHNYPFREKRFELWPKSHGREKLSKKLHLSHWI